MKSNEFITEAEVKPYKYSNLELEEALTVLRKNCSESFALINKPIWRGFRDHGEDIVQINPSTGVRKSQNTSNHSTSLMDNSPYFAGWPKRSESLICSTGLNYANGYSGYTGGGLYAIFPYNGVPIAVCNARDIWETTIKIPELNLSFNGTDARRQFNYFLEKSLGLPEDFKGMVNAINQDPKVAKRLASICNAVRVPVVTPDQLMPILQKAISPAATKMKLMSIQEFASASVSNKEVWIGGPVVAIKNPLFLEFQKHAKNAAKQG